MTAAMQWSGTKRDDRFVFDNDGDRFDFVIGGGGDDFISDGVADSHWSSDFFHGQAGDDTLLSTEGHDVLRGGRGNDVLEVRLAWYDPADDQFPVPDTEPGQVGFDVHVFGGQDYDRLVISQSKGYTMETVGNDVIIRSVWGGTLTIRGVEDFEFV